MSVFAQRVRQLLPTGIWSIDPAESSIEFRLKHLLLTSVRGRFADFEGVLDVGPDGEPTVSGSVQVASVDTGDRRRDEHLCGPDFFDVAAHPELTFFSTAVERLGDSRLRILGDVTLKGVTRPLALTATIHGVRRDAAGHERLRLEARGELDRREFGIAASTPLEVGGLLLGDSVGLELAVSAVRQRVAPAAA